MNTSELIMWAEKILHGNESDAPDMAVLAKAIRSLGDQFAVAHRCLTALYFIDTNEADYAKGLSFVIHKTGQALGRMRRMEDGEESDKLTRNLNG